MKEKHGEFREGESRSDFDMTKKAEAFDSNGFYAGTKDELEVKNQNVIHTNDHIIIHSDKQTKFIAKSKFSKRGE